MNQGKYVFAQLMRLIKHKEFTEYVDKYRGNYRVRDFTCWHQFLCMSFGQLTNRESLRDTVVCLQAHDHKLYHLGLTKGVKKSTLADANEKRDWRIYAEFAQVLITQARQLCQGDQEDEVHDQTYVYLTNHFEAAALQITILHVNRWKVEIFFKWVQQHLRIKKFWGESPNAVKTQIWIAVCTFVLVAILKYRLNSQHSLNET